jgi:hypothetical protein
LGIERGPQDEWRRRNWLAIAIGTVVMMFSYFPYAAAFATAEGEALHIDVGLVGIGLVMAPFVFIAVAFISRGPTAPKRVIQAMGLLILIGLSVGMLAPVLGATAGFGAGATICLNPPSRARDVYKWRWGATGLTVVYTLFLLVVATPAGVFSGGLLPLMMVGLADEYAIWIYQRDQTAGAN